MARKRVETEPALRSWQAVDDALREIRECKYAITEMDVECKRRTDEVRGEFKNKQLPLQNRIKRLEADIKEFTDAHRAELSGKSRRLTFGSVFYRLSSRLRTNLSDADTIALLEAMGRTEFIKTTKTLDRAALLRQPQELLDKIDAWVQTRDNFDYEADDPEPEV